MTQSAINAAKIIHSKIGDFKPVLAIVLGSGLGGIADLLTDAIKISYADLPDFPPCGVSGHAGVLHLGYLNGVPVACLQGRAHLYEGVSNLVAKTYVRTMKLIGCETMLLTNACGSMREDIVPGNLVLIHDYINRPRYHVIEKIFNKINSVDTLAIFVKKSVDINLINELYQHYKFHIR